MDIRELFDVFSRRNVKPEKPPKPLTETFRKRVLMLCRDRFSAERVSVQEFWIEIHGCLCYLLGRPSLSGHSPPKSQVDDVVNFLLTCSDEHFLDFIEYIFQVESYFQVSWQDDNSMVEEISHFFLLDDLPYDLTPFVRETRTEQLFRQPSEVQVVVSHPKVILRDHQIPYSEAIKPAIHLLADEGLTSANLEFLGALEDYRKGRYPDCLTKCCSALESTMKLICARKKWPYQETDTAGTLLRIILEKSTLDSFFEQPLLNIARMRNRLSSSHGAGAQPREVPPHKARYAINATAAAILLLVEECR